MAAASKTFFQKMGEAFGEKKKGRKKLEKEKKCSGKPVTDGDDKISDIYCTQTFAYSR